MNKKVILVADDNRHCRAFLHKRLSTDGFRVLEAADGLEAIRCAGGVRLDAIILDQGMPNGDGISVARLIRKEQHVPIIFVSGHSKEEFRSVVTQLPDTYYLAKPLEDGKLTDLLESLLGSPASFKSRPDCPAFEPRPVVLAH